MKWDVIDYRFGNEGTRRTVIIRLTPETEEEKKKIPRDKKDKIILLERGIKDPVQLNN